LQFFDNGRTENEPVPEANQFSPIEERHLDFLLEEEFATNSTFLEFFIKLATESNHDSPRPPLPPSQDWNCRAIRSVTTSAGESDVLVTYKSAAPGSPRVAILIEDKIDAVFQPNQPQRYVERGETQTGINWDKFWTCLVAPQKYGHDLAGFDARVSLESIRDFFRSSGDTRSTFKANIIEQALKKFGDTGIKNVDPIMTEFRTFYAQQAELYFSETGPSWEPARDAWYDDSWFNFRSQDLPKDSVIVHKIKAGVVHLSFRNLQAESVHEALKEPLQNSRIKVVQTGKSASLQISVSPIHNFTDPSQSKDILATAFLAVDELFQFWREMRMLLELSLNLEFPLNVEHQMVEQSSQVANLRAVQSMLHGLIKSRAIGFNAPPPSSLPNLVLLASRNETALYFPVIGMAGGFDIRLTGVDQEGPKVFAQSGSRIYDGWMRHTITAFAVKSEPLDYLSDGSFDEWISVGFPRP
jgi:hypothetical protein